MTTEGGKTTPVAEPAPAPAPAKVPEPAIAGPAAGEEASAASPASAMPHLESVDHFNKIPLVEAAWKQSADIYGRVKGANAMFTWTLNAAEATMQKAAEQAAPIAGPIAKKLETPITMVDQTLLKGLTMVENKVPIVKEQPQQIYETAKSYLTPACSKASAVADYGTEKAKSLKELSWTKANEVLSSQYGTVAYSGFDKFATKADQYLNYYFPPSKEEVDAEQSTELQLATDDRVLHTVQTVGRLSSKLGRRVYITLSVKINTLKKQSVHDYISSLLAAIHLTSYLNAFHSSQTSPQPSSDAPTPAQSTQSPQAVPPKK